MTIKYIPKEIAEKRFAPISDWSRRKYMTRDGYTKRCGAPANWMIRFEGEKVWRRVRVWQFSNAGTVFVNIKGEPHVIGGGLD
jgi:hypothetical protein